MTIELGKPYKDTISGFVGIAVERNTYLNGCVSYVIEGKITNKGERSRHSIFDMTLVPATESEWSTEGEQ